MRPVTVMARELISGCCAVDMVMPLGWCGRLAPPLPIDIPRTVEASPFRQGTAKKSWLSSDKRGRLGPCGGDCRMVRA
ncbi:hypothetical protein GCM10007884_17870 [Methylobacterium brachythecii]|uniref:Uncharacterized protein n=1 Tax=Methylobacterium brachythecii TaxID=1176177 RepID=A0ABQ6D6K2_9HYPH|nr:hypothetical protein GCM10007884_17870 [Methylobacterium brachythecii]